MKTRRLHVVHQLQELNDSCDPILSLMTDDELMKKMETMRDSRTIMNLLQDDLRVRSLYLSVAADVLQHVILQTGTQSALPYDTLIPSVVYAANSMYVIHSDSYRSFRKLQVRKTLQILLKEIFWVWFKI